MSISKGVLSTMRQSMRIHGHPARRPDRRLRCRDEIAYRSSDTFDIRRTNQPRLRPIFGFGAHRCIGEALARAEL